MREISIRIKVLASCNGDEKNPTEVLEIQGLTSTIECWLQIINNICIERSLVNRKKIKGFPTCFARMENSCKRSDPVTLLLQPHKR
jgi:hypothetical protein